MERNEGEDDQNEERAERDDGGEHRHVQIAEGGEEEMHEVEEYQNRRPVDRNSFDYSYGHRDYGFDEIVEEQVEQGTLAERRRSAERRFIDLEDNEDDMWERHNLRVTEQLRQNSSSPKSVIPSERSYDSSIHIPRRNVIRDLVLEEEQLFILINGKTHLRNWDNLQPSERTDGFALIRSTAAKFGYEFDEIASRPNTRMFPLIQKYGHRFSTTFKVMEKEAMGMMAQHIDNESKRQIFWFSKFDVVSLKNGAPFIWVLPFTPFTDTDLLKMVQTKIKSLESIPKNQDDFELKKLGQRLQLMRNVTKEA